MTINQLLQILQNKRIKVQGTYLKFMYVLLLPIIVLSLQPLLYHNNFTINNSHSYQNYIQSIHFLKKITHAQT